MRERFVVGYPDKFQSLKNVLSLDPPFSEGP
jgi:hypothetical protein